MEVELKRSWNTSWRRGTNLNYELKKRFCGGRDESRDEIELGERRINSTRAISRVSVLG